MFVLKLDKIVLYFDEEEHFVHIITKLIRTMFVLVPIPPTHKQDQEFSLILTLILVLKIRFAFGRVFANLDQN